MVRLIVTCLFYFIIITMVHWLLMQIVYLFIGSKYIYWALPTVMVPAAYAVFVFSTNNYVKDMAKTAVAAWAVLNIIMAVLVPCDPALRISAAYTLLLVSVNVAVLYLLWRKRNSYAGHINNFSAGVLAFIIVLNGYFYTEGFYMVYEYLKAY